MGFAFREQKSGSNKRWHTNKAVKQKQCKVRVFTLNNTVSARTKDIARTYAVHTFNDSTQRRHTIQKKTVACSFATVKEKEKSERLFRWKWSYALWNCRYFLSCVCVYLFTLARVMCTQRDVLICYFGPCHVLFCKCFYHITSTMQMCQSDNAWLYGKINPVSCKMYS